MTAPDTTPPDTTPPDTTPYDTTPYDAERAAFSREALARLALSSAAVGTAGGAHALVPTRHDTYTGLGGRVSEAVYLTRAAEGVLVRAVVYERERGASWAEIAHYLGVGAQEAEERFGPELDRWAEAFRTPYRLDPTGRKRVPQLPTAAYDPVSVVRWLDLWAGSHISGQGWCAVSEGLPDRIPPKDDDHTRRRSRRGPDDVGGTVAPTGLRRFLEHLWDYVVRGDHVDTEVIDWDALAPALGTTYAECAPYEHTLTLVGPAHVIDVHLAREAGEDEVSVTVTGADSGDLRIRIDTLIDVFAPGSAELL
ncbi:hypothetical protein SGFS_077720 [Streptomyces graminofaciens]|uniref:Uncharacterized protein n=1 Tax=Streptomyces graminofaciens TaxID=68212 RepID=A0ABN5VVC5_9ACTN|nr:hypothetical protein [Streptomyces graminofaciens]BBC36478.1 hypothetical protein SGFS_077720 [Streptomyces graminofaciens]